MHARSHGLWGRENEAIGATRQHANWFHVEANWAAGFLHARMQRHSNLEARHLIRILVFASEGVAPSIRGRREYFPRWKAQILGLFKVFCSLSELGSKRVEVWSHKHKSHLPIEKISTWPNILFTSVTTYQLHNNIVTTYKYAVLSGFQAERRGGSLPSHHLNPRKWTVTGDH